MISGNIGNIDEQNKEIIFSLHSNYHNLLCEISEDCNAKTSDIIRDAIALNVLVRHFEKEDGIVIPRQEINNSDPVVVKILIKTQSYISINGYVKSNDLESIESFIIESIALYLDMLAGDFTREGKYVHDKGNGVRLEIFMGDIAKLFISRQ